MLLEVAVVPNIVKCLTKRRLPPKVAVFSLRTYFLKILMIPKIIIANNVSIAMISVIMLIASIPVI